MNRFRMLVLGLGLSASLALSALAAPPDATKKAGTMPAATTAAAPKKTGASAMTAQTPPGPGYVWVNKSSKVFHREGTQYFGKTKNGEFMKEADAVAAGYREAGKGGAASAKAPKAASAAAGKSK